jgi:uncharacterized membrane protein
LKKSFGALPRPGAPARRRPILGESTDSPAVVLLDLTHPESESHPKHFFNGLLECRAMAESEPKLPDYEGTPLTRGEYIAAIVHLYRGELYRATAWRIRLDTTTNWAVLTTAGLLAFSFRDIGREVVNPHWPLLIGTLIVTLLLGYEARRYQVFDVWRARVRKIEENFYGPILRRNPVSPQREWGERVAHDLLQPRYKISFLTALRARFLRNYWAIYVVIVLSWMLKIVISPNEAHSWAEIKSNLDLGSGMIPWWSSLVYLGLFLLAVLGLVFLVPSIPDDEEDEFWTPSHGTSGRISPLDV